MASAEEQVEQKEQKVTTIPIDTIGGKPWHEVLNLSGENERVEARGRLDTIIAMWPHDNDGIWKLLDRCTVAERDLIKSVLPPADELPQGLWDFLELTYADMDKEEGQICVHHIDMTTGEKDTSVMKGESIGGGISSGRKQRTNAVNSILNNLVKMGLRELYNEITESRPTKTDKDNVWSDWFVKVAKVVTAKMHSLPEDNNVLRVMGKVGELELAHGGVMSQVTRGVPYYGRMWDRNQFWGPVRKMSLSRGWINLSRRLDKIILSLKRDLGP